MLQALKLRTQTSDAAFERLWEAQRPRIQRLATRLCGNPELAEDLTQEIGLQALAAYPTFRRQCAPTTFLYRIAVRTIHRYRDRHPAVSLEPEHAERLPDPTTLAPPDQSLTLAQALTTLPDELRTTLLLRLYEGLSCREIAAVLEIPLGTVLSRLHTARERLRKELTDDHAL
ncbi:RNA polymerase sigma factor [Armatimonas rosea]|uniref:RNA polymerase sigma-70 factor (ECF subfamily) n=1 Tax=Armatimonas rosea TaxID=685828 RepID=A0A7W9W584_ARMRO|nr:RNA polymerase sigma factor [Armatimonas rosea]MBB6049308.1 RNA polymerase sigma-70 factor (ECF subfamily) [Armatimonas rosea]